MKPRSLLAGCIGFGALSAIAGCSHYLLAQRQPWRQEAELACLNAGVPQELPDRVRIASIEGPGACGIDYPLKVSELGENTAPLSYSDQAPRPPGSIPGPYPAPLVSQASGAAPQHWPLIESSALPPLQSAAAPGDAASNPEPYPPSDGAAQAVAPPAGAPLSLWAPGVAAPAEDELPISEPPPHPYYGAPSEATVPPSLYSRRPLSEPPAPPQASPPGDEALPPLGPARAPLPGEAAASAGPVELRPAATLACPIVSALDKWVAAAVQPAALKWFHQPVVEIKQIGSYSCRGMINGNPNAPISEHAFGNALDIAEFDLADGRKISVEYGWRGRPEEQGFLHDVQDAACQDFNTVLAPGANIYHYNHIHVDLMQRKYRPHICEPAAIAGDVAAARARTYAAEHSDPGVTGSIQGKLYAPPLGYSDSDHLPPAVPGED